MDKKSLLFIVMVCMGAVLFFSYAAEVRADDKVNLTGFIENQTALRMENGTNDAYQLSRMRNTLQVEVAASITDWMKFNTTVRGYFDAAYELDHTISDIPKHASSVPEGRHNEKLYGDRNMEQEVDLREYYLRIFNASSTLKIGRQQIVWGEADLFRMSDIINPLDMSAGGIFVQDLENVRIPLRAVDFVYEVPGQHHFKIELVAIPEDFRTTTLAAPGANWDPTWGTGWGLGFPPVSFFQAMWQTQARQLREIQENDLKNFQGGMRLRGRIGDWDASLFYYYSRVQDAVMTANTSFNPLPIILGGPFTVGNFPMKFHWPWVQNIGGTFNIPVPGGFILRGEGAYTIDQPFAQDPLVNELFKTIPIPVSMFGAPSARYGESDVLAFFIGFDRPTMITFLNPTQSFFISGQLYQKYILNFDDRFNSTGMGENGRSKHQTNATLLINTEYFDGKIAPEVVGAYDPGASSGLVKATLTYKPTYRINIALGGIWLFAQKDSAALTGAFRKNDEVSLILKYTF